LSGRFIEKVVWVSSIYNVEAAGASDLTADGRKAFNFS
jgi:hypothetical protein